MATLNIYLTFEGDCEKAFSFYQSVFETPYTDFVRFKDLPQDPGQPPLSAEEQEKIMHVKLPVSKETCLMGSDTHDAHPEKLIRGTNYSISIIAESKKEADRIFGKLSENANITMPLQNTFWGAYFGMLTDQFGIQWLVNFDAAPSEP